MHEELLASSIAQALSLPHVIARIVVSRGFKTVAAVRELLFGSATSENDPFTMLSMRAAVDWILEIRKRGESVFIFGDYDLDGLSSVALLSHGLSAAGIKTDWRLPSRFGSGYGLSIASIDEMLESGAKNLITVDTGITANPEIAYAKEHGMRVMVIDHHQPSGEGLPNCDVLLDPHQDGDVYANSELCGVGVAYKFICAFFKMLEQDVPESYLELVALGTLADLVPMTPENRLFTRRGLFQMQKSAFPGIRELCRTQFSGTYGPSAQGVMFKIAPLLNAPGRMEKPDPALSVLLAETEQNAKECVAALGSWNRRRKDTENAISKAAVQRVQELYGENLPSVLIVDGADWHQGVIGIVAAKLTQEFSRPAAVISIQKDGTACASARAIPGFNWHKALFASRDLFIRWGGHSNAAGFSLLETNIAEFRRRTNEMAEEFSEIISAPEKITTIPVALSELTDAVMQNIVNMEPLIGNFPPPLFRAENVLIHRVRELRGGHLCLELSQGNLMRFAAIGFGMASLKESIAKPGFKINIEFELAWNIYNGQRSLQLQAKKISAN